MRGIRSNQGFTLIELLIVVVIIGILATVLISRFSGAKSSAYLAQVNAVAQQVSQAAMTYQAASVSNTRATTIAHLQSIASELAATMGDVNLAGDGAGNWTITHDVLDTDFGSGTVSATVDTVGGVTAAALP